MENLGCIRFQRKSLLEVRCAWRAVRFRWRAIRKTDQQGTACQLSYPGLVGDQRICQCDPTSPLTANPRRE